VLSPILSFTFEPTPRPLIPLISYHFLICSCSNSYLLIPFVQFLFTPVYLFLSDPFLLPCDWQSCSSIFLMLLYHVLTEPHVHLIAPPPELRYLFLLCLLISEHFLYLNLVSPSIQINLIIAFIVLFSHCLSLHIFFILCSLTPTSSDSIRPLSDFHLTLVSDDCSEIIGHTH